ncbi:conserved hypothetical protein [Culex quinquefasciatus]|uniref:DUF1279 domain-containing protein n=1 Tax=Culex quinquefasciatus TaxID=7176 RepID=B0XJP3_CULQU|nr:conserved hypothetical protein [Culex quinquefasciatus]|eukprot:XP_001869865.1 conserved hypothetical protein [Culex quinquefasciatus]
MAQQVQLVFKTALKATQGGAPTIGRSMSTGALGTIDASSLSPKRTPGQGLHVTVQRDYPAAAALPLPANIDPTETTRFSPQRARDINSSAMLTHPHHQIDVTVDSSPYSAAATVDPHVQSYDCRGAVSLNSAMQSNVPSPFGGMHKFSHLNMPGGGWAQEGKYLAHDLNSSHYINLRKEVRSEWSSYEDKPRAGTSVLLARIGQAGLLGPKTNSSSGSNGTVRKFSTEAKQSTEGEQGKGTGQGQEQVGTVSRKDRLKKAVKEYGSTVIVFHVGISLASLGACYLLVSSGIDVVALLERFGWGDSALASKAGAGAGTFVIAYAIHKVFAPVRISITLGATPLIVRALRKPLVDLVEN